VNGLHHRLPRNARLANKRDFAAVLKRPCQRVCRPGVEVFVAVNTVSESRLGIIVGRSYDRRSTCRHRFKRHVREAFRHRRREFAGFDVLVKAKRTTACNVDTSKSLINDVFDEVLSQLDMPQRETGPVERSPLAKSVLAILKVYQLTLSPLLGPRCRFHPTCSSYAMQAVREHGVRRGLGLTARRLAKCHPWHPGGIDLVPDSSR